MRQPARGAAGAAPGRPAGHRSPGSSANKDDRFEPDEAFEDALDELDIDPEGEAEEPLSGDFVSATAAAAQLRRAGFRDVHAEETLLGPRYDRATYVDFLEEYAEQGLFADLDAGPPDATPRTDRGPPRPAAG